MLGSVNNLRLWVFMAGILQPRIREISQYLTRLLPSIERLDGNDEVSERRRQRRMTLSSMRIKMVVILHRCQIFTRP
jgi:hypothetical protein